jgi:hypothetical protein
MQRAAQQSKSNIEVVRELDGVIAGQASEVRIVFTVSLLTSPLSDYSISTHLSPALLARQTPSDLSFTSRCIRVGCRFNYNPQSPQWGVFMLSATTNLSCSFLSCNSISRTSFN